MTSNNNDSIVEVGLELYKIMLKNLKKQSNLELIFGENLNRLAENTKNISESINISKDSLEEIVSGIDNITEAGKTTRNSLNESNEILNSNKKRVEDLNTQAN